MKILAMTATFGKLDNATLEFGPGLNVICAPNEWGKSTWCAFLTAMLYGVDTKSRSTQDRLAEKEKYTPWSGKPMEGTLRVEYQGRDITIQRRAKGRTPLGAFAAYETLTGIPVPELTAENCGKTLLGVERSVFQRTGFIRFSDLPVEQDEALRRRLNALVTTGDETGSADLLARKLRELKNKCRYNRSGLIPEVGSQIQTIQEQLREQETLAKQKHQLEEKIRQIQSDLDALEIHRRSLAYAEAREDRQRVEEAAQSAKFAQNTLERMEEICKNHPEKEELLAKTRQARGVLEQIGKKREEKPVSMIPAVALWIAAVLALGCGALLWAAKQTIPASAAAGLFVLLAVIAGIVTGKRREKELQRRMERQKLDRRKEELENGVQRWEKQLSDLSDLEQARKEADRTRSHLQTLLSMARSAERPDGADDLTLTREETMAALTEKENVLRRSQMELAQCRGRMENLPDREILAGQLELAQGRLGRLEQTYRAVDYAQKALEAAMQELQRRFAPRITRRTGEFLNRLTGGRYDRLSIGDDLTVQAARSEETTLRSAQWRSEGTADQMYLALRLAVWEALTPEAPLVLDDALVRFDRERLENAVRLLEELGQRRQILLFSCQEREKELLNR